jgi:hypothetical protein
VEYLQSSSRRCNAPELLNDHDTLLSPSTVAQSLCESLVAQGRQKEAVEYLQSQQQTLESVPSSSSDSSSVNAVELQLLLGKVLLHYLRSLSSQFLLLRQASCLNLTVGCHFCGACTMPSHARSPGKCSLRGNESYNDRYVCAGVLAVGQA